jgi:hypothetical protein
MNENVAREILHELVASLEALETQSGAILQFLKDKGIASGEQLAPYLEAAGKASNVRWRAASVRLERLLSTAFKPVEDDAGKQPSQPATGSQQTKGPNGDSEQKEPEARPDGARKPVAEGKSEANDRGVDAEAAPESIRKDNKQADESAA